MDIDSLLGLNNEFPKPESNQILVMDGFGMLSASLKLLLPASLLACVLKPVGKVQFQGLFDERIVAEGILYQLPDTLRIAYSSGNPLYQEISRSDSGEELFTVLYDRGYSRVECKSFEILEAAGINLEDIPSVKMNPDNKEEWRFSESQPWTDYADALPPQEMLETFWRECQHKLKQSTVFQ